MRASRGDTGWAGCDRAVQPAGIQKGGHSAFCKQKGISTKEDALLRKSAMSPFLCPTEERASTAISPARWRRAKRHGGQIAHAERLQSTPPSCNLRRDRPKIARAPRNGRTYSGAKRPPVAAAIGSCRRYRRKRFFRRLPDRPETPWHTTAANLKRSTRGNPSRWDQA
jgi:hypothetical protein